MDFCRKVGICEKSEKNGLYIYIYIYIYSFVARHVIKEESMNFSILDFCGKVDIYSITCVNLRKWSINQL